MGGIGSGTANFGSLLMLAGIVCFPVGIALLIVGIVRRVRLSDAVSAAALAASTPMPPTPDVTPPSAPGDVSGV